MLNRNTGRRILAHVPVEDGRARSIGDFVVAGVPGSGAPLVTEYLHPAGAVTGRLLPTGVPCQPLSPLIGDPVQVSIVDVTAPVVLVAAEQLGPAATCSPAEMNADGALLARLESIRACAAVALGFAGDEADALRASAALPRIAVVSPPHDHVLADGTTLTSAEHDIAVRATSMQRVHHAIPLTTAMCVAVSTRIAGTAAAAVAAVGDTAVRVAHPKGVLPVGLDVVAGEGGVQVNSVSVTRTARRLLAGTAYVRAAGERRR